jgi:ABC-type sugar transport system ATPase subunit
MELVEIARAIARGGKVFVFDESTAALGASEVMTLLERMRGLAATGAAIIFISHHVDEVLSVCDRVVVLRDGWKVLDERRGAVDNRSVIEAMLGARIGETSKRAVAEPSPDGRIALTVSDWRVGRGPSSRLDVGPIDFTLREGEVLGVFGALGAGKTELLHSLFGLAEGEVSGKATLAGNPLPRFRGPRVAIAHGIALVAADRQKEGVVPELSVLENMMLGYHRGELSWRRLAIRHETVRAACERLIAELGIKAESPDQPIRSLSGGNQQKVLLARAILNEPRLLLLDEPTRGIDVGARRDVYRWIRKMADNGSAIVISSLEEGELVGLADRILVLGEGRVLGVVDGRTATEHDLLTIVVGGTVH